ncbi:sugar-phosphatase [Sphingomonas trueperi]|uniref:HAD-IA family hydrolase n=1 Tax=Sphingomonas trueperi TaxID=53317 RepID=UPI00339609B3
MTDTQLAQQIDAILLDMDGTILNSIKAAEQVWGAWAARHGIDVASFLPTIHGVQTVETIRRAAIPGLDPEQEAAAITQAEINAVDGIEEIAGAAAFLAALPRSRWAIVTSAPRALALRRIEAAGLPEPALLISAEDVARGKPEPDCFLLAAEQLGTTADRCLVLEDSPAGIAAACKAGAHVLVVTATHHSPMDCNHPSILDYNDLKLAPLPEGAVTFSCIGKTGSAWALG